MFQRIACGNIDGLLALHGTLHDSMVRFERLHIIILGSKNLLLDALAKTILGYLGDDNLSMFFFGVDPTYDLVHLLRAHGSVVELLDLNHGLADGLAALLDFLHDGGIIEDSARDLAVASAETEDEVQRGFLLDVVVGEGAAVLELLAGKNEALLVGRDPLFVLDLSLYIINGVGRLDIEGDGLSGESLYENLHFDWGFVFAFVMCQWSGEWRSCLWDVMIDDVRVIGD